jgi:hypothetical protein
MSPPQRRDERGRLLSRRALLGCVILGGTVLLSGCTSSPSPSNEAETPNSTPSSSKTTSPTQTRTSLPLTGTQDILRLANDTSSHHIVRLVVESADEESTTLSYSLNAGERVTKTSEPALETESTVTVQVASYDSVRRAWNGGRDGRTLSVTIEAESIEVAVYTA